MQIGPSLSEVIKKTEFYDLLDTHQQKNKKKKMYAKCFEQQTTEKYYKVLARNESIFLREHQIPFCFPDHLLFIHQILETNRGFCYLVQPYTVNLSQEIEKKGPFSENQALKIFEQMLKATYSLHQKDIYSKNLRPDQFVKVGDTWKLSNIVISIRDDGKIKSEYHERKQYYPPELYQNQKLGEKNEYLKSKTVWDLGCILIHLLLGNHKLKSYQILKKFENDPFSFESIGAAIGKKFSDKLKKNLARMCHYNLASRMSLNQLFSKDFFSEEIAQDLSSSSKGSKGSNFSSNMSRGRVISVDYEQQERELDSPYKNPYADGDQKTPGISKLKPGKKIPNQFEEDSRIEIFVPENNENENQNEVHEYPNSIINIRLTQPKLSDQSVSQPKIYDHRVRYLFESIVQRHEIMDMDEWKDKQIERLFPEQSCLKQYLIRYCLSFVNCIYLRRLSEEESCKEYFCKELLKEYQIEFQQFEAYMKTNQFKEQLNKIRKFKKTQEENLDLYRELVVNSISQTKFSDQELQNFVCTQDPSNCSFQDIKGAYRNTIYNQLIKPLREAYKKNKNASKKRDEAEFIMHASFWLSFNKVYVRSQFFNRFADYFEEFSEQPSLYISSQKYLRYLRSISEQRLSAMSSYILQTYFEYGKS